MNSISFIFAVHNHQPIGNFDFVFEEVYQKSYKPFLDVVEEFPDVKVTQHYTGILIDWLKSHHPEFILRLKKLVNNGQVELLTGAYYEAILPVIPPHDRVSQIEKLTKNIIDVFDYTPKGMWLAERVWEQPVVKEIVQAGVQFLPIDEAHFKYAGVREEGLYGYYTTEEEGYVFKIFPGSKKLRYTIPFALVEETIGWLNSKATEMGNRIAVFADDGEKLGAWPQTYEHVYTNGWLRNFFQALTENSRWIKSIHFSDAIKDIKPVGRVYLPTASYPEMLTWALPVDSVLEFEEFENILKSHQLDKFDTFVRGGYWRNFLAKYPEANWLHKKMLRVSNKIRAIEQNGMDVSEAKNHLMAGQCNDAYWHGVFGGLYLPNLRYPVYNNLIKAECLIDKSKPNLKITDFDCDGKNEILYESPLINMYIKPEAGGAIREIDFKEKAVNLIDIVSRREEASHKKLSSTKEEYLQSFLVYDRYQRACLVDHFFGGDVTVEKFLVNDYEELGDFVNQNYQYNIKQSGKKTSIKLERVGIIKECNSRKNIKIVKNILLKNTSSDIQIDYQIKKLEQAPVKLRFGVEFNFGLMAGDADDRYYKVEGVSLRDKRLKSVGCVPDIKNISLIDEWQGLEIGIETTIQADFWRCPIETVSRSEAGIEKLYQSSTVMPVWNLEITGDWRTTIFLKIRSL
ncbi:MAG: DUF1926 domain-containing protein [Bacteroidota bacterium]|nr:DUF1926 domain-containing protein [Bacteroidota bacterium]